MPHGQAMLNLGSFRLRYILALGLVAALTLSAQILVHLNLDENEGYARTVNLAGRQRMLAMGLTRTAYALLPSDQPRRARLLNEMALDLHQWREMNHDLGEGRQDGGLRAGGPAIRQGWRELSPLIARIDGTAEEVLRQFREGDPPASTQALVTELFELGQRYLPAMDALVGRYAEESRQRSRTLQTLGMTMAGLVLALLLAEALFVFRPITRRIRSDMFRLTALAEEMSELSRKDGLTNVYNRRHFDEQIAQEWRRAAREDQVLSLLIMDIDHFKRFNDHYGHQAGDQALRNVAGAAAAQLKRPGDLLARYGGEEFAVILPQTGLEGARHMAEAIRRAVEELAVPNSGSLAAPVLTVSLGVAADWPARNQGPENLVEAADQALYRAKHSGRNRVAGPPGETPEDWS